MSGVSLSPDTVACRGRAGTNLWLGRTRVRAESRDWGDDGGGPAGLGKMKRRAAVGVARADASSNRILSLAKSVLFDEVRKCVRA